MIRDYFGKVIRLGPLGDDGRCVRDVLEQRTVREKSATRDKNNARVWLTVTNEISGCDRTPVFQHDIEDNDLGRVFTQESDSFFLTGHNVNVVVLSFQVLCPDFCQLGI